MGMRRGPSSTFVPAIMAVTLIGSFLFVGGTSAAAPAASKTGSSHIQTASSHFQVGQVKRAAQTHGPYTSSARLPLAVSEANPPNPGKPGASHHTPPPPTNNAAIPTVSCAPALTGCDTISPSSGGASTNPHAMAATDNSLL